MRRLDEHAQRANREPMRKERMSRVLTVEGVGQGAQKCDSKCSASVCLSDGTEGSYAAPILENSDVPGLLGLESLKKHRALMDTYNGRLFFIGPGGYQLGLSPGSKVFELEESPSKHWLLPCTEWSQAGTGNGQTVIRGYRPVGKCLPEESGMSPRMSYST